jgi:hypothetical protein
MILNNLKKDPAKMVSVGMAFVVVGLMILVIAINWPRLPFLAYLWPDKNDFLRGFAYGIAIVLEISGVAINASAAANKRKAL